MDEKYLTKVWELANKFVGKTIHAEHDAFCGGERPLVR